MNHLLQRLKPNQRQGSKPRCHLLTHGSPEQVAERLTGLIAPWGSVAATDHWMPQGFDVVNEARLGTAARLIPDEYQRLALIDWWLAVPRSANTTNWDIASTCVIGGKPGLLLVEAKSHDAELRNEEKGKEKPSATVNSRLNHEQIGTCLEKTSLALTEQTNLSWALSRDCHYQMSNRFAWSWKLTSLGIPVILVYLGFLDCQEMQRHGQLPFAKHEDWDRLVKLHSNSLFPTQVWDQQWSTQGQVLIPIIRTMNQPLGDNP